MTNNIVAVHWKASEKFIFRIAFIYFALQIVPLDWKYYAHLLSIDWTVLHFRDIFYISRYTPQLFGTYTRDHWGLATFADWGVLLLLAVIGAVIWSIRDRKSINYERLYYGLRVLARYRLAIAVIAYGFIKLYPLQSPYPSLSHLNTPYGNFSAWKLFSLSLGIVPGYESFLGGVEIAAGLLLLFRKTASFGAVILIFFTGNVFMSNLAYEGGEAAYSFFLVTLALLVLSYDLNRITQLLIRQQPTLPVVFVPLFSGKRWQQARLIVKGLFIFFFIALYGFKVYAVYKKGGYHYPSKPGLAKLQGYYTVSRFILNGQDRPYSRTDSLRWQNVVFEKWATFSVGTFSQQTSAAVNTEEIQPGYESGGSSGRKYYNYTADTAQQVLVLQNAGSLRYSIRDSVVILQNDSVYAELNKTDKKYLLKEAKTGRRKPLKL